MSRIKKTFAPLSIIFIITPLIFASPFSYAEDSTVDLIKLKPDDSNRTVLAVPDEVNVKYDDDATAREKRDFRNENDLTKEFIRIDPLRAVDTENLKLEQSLTPQMLKATVEELKDLPNVDYVEPNYVMGIQSTPSPSLGSGTPSSPEGDKLPNDHGYQRQWSPGKIHVMEAWEKGMGDPKVVIAVLDTGFDFNHEDKPVHVVPGYDFINNDADPQDDHGHGTYIAGVIAANTNNSHGIAGLCPSCSIMPVKVMDNRGMGTYADVTKGILWATDHGAKIINLSIGGYAYSQILQDAITYAQDKGVLVIAAGGNQGVSDPLYPAAYPNVIGVSATDEEDQRWSGSNFGDSIDLAAPGVSVYGLFLNSTYRSQSGTSSSAAHVAGVAGLLLSQNSTLVPNALAQKLYDSSKDLGTTGRDGYFGWGRVEGEEKKVPEEVPTEASKSKDPLVGPRDGNETIGKIPKSESNEGGDKDTNNNNAKNFQNLAITGIQIEPSIFKIGEHANIIVQVQNQGKVEEKNIKVKLFINGHFIAPEQVIDAIISQGNKSTQFPWQPTFDSNQKAKLLIKAQIDRVTNETTTDDNFLTIDFLAKNENGLVTIQYATDVHQYLTEQGVYYLQGGGVNPQAYDEMKSYIPQLRQGAFDEDETGCFGNPIDVLWRPLRHFYRPTDRKGYSDITPFNNSAGLVPCGVRITPNQTYPNSYQWANGQQPENTHDFQDAIDAYKRGDKAMAYQILGHVLHLIEDASVPEHTQLESHYDDPITGGLETGSGYEQYVSDQYNSNESGPANKLNDLLHPTCISSPGSDPRTCFYSAHTKPVFSYYNEVLSRLTSLNQYFDSMANLSYHRNRFKGNLDKNTGTASGQLKELFPSLHWNAADHLWEINDLGRWGDRSNHEVHLDDEWWETSQFDHNTNEDPGWFYIENSYKKIASPEVRPARYEADWYSYALNEMKKSPPLVRFGTPYNGTYVNNDLNNGKVLAGVFADDLIPLAVQHVAGVMDLFWKETHEDDTPPRPQGPDLIPVMDGAFHFTESRTSFAYRYELTMNVKNIGTAAADSGQLCFTPIGALPYLCSGTGSIGRLAPGEIKAVTLSFFTLLLLTGTQLGTVKIKSGSVAPTELSLLNNEAGIFSGVLVRAGGVDMTFAEMSGIKIDPVSHQIRFILKGTEAQPGDPVIDLGATQSNITKIFLQALAIPNSKHYISLDIQPDASGQLRGSARIPSPFEQTDVADRFLKADVGMKFDLFGAGRTYDSVTAWTNLIQASPYWGELSSKGFNRYPEWVIAATIVPGQIQAHQTGNDFFLEDVRIDINAGWWMREPTINLDGLGLSEGARADVISRLATHKRQIEDAVKNRAATFTVPALNSTDPTIDSRFKGLRTIYAALAAAQWYKEQVRSNPNLPYAHLVDSEDLTGIGMDTPFDRPYWDAQAYQALGAYPCTGFAGASTCNAQGGASLEDSRPRITGTLTETQDSILTQVTGGAVVKTTVAAYVPGGTIVAAAPDLEMPALTAESDTYLKGGNLHFSIHVSNSGPVDTSGVVLKLQDEVTALDGSKVVYPITEQTINALASWEIRELPFEWTLPEVAGTHVIVALVDPRNTIQELNESNNRTQTVLKVVDPRPLVTLIAPDAGSVVHPNNLTLRARAFDSLTELAIENSAFIWSSSLQGILGTGALLTVPSLLTGDHQITLTVAGPQGVSETKTFSLFVRPMGSPLPRIRFPVNGARLSQELTYALRGEAEDNEDGALGGSNLRWSSSIDGPLGVGASLNRGLSLGVHTLTLSATDRDGQSSSAQIQITVEQGTPTVSMASPTEGILVVLGSAVHLSATAMDPQEGDLGSRILWSSDRDGVLGQGTELDRVLTVGAHRVTARVTDSDGLQANVTRTVTVQNTPPMVTITAPLNRDRVSFGTPVTLRGGAQDSQDGAMPNDRLIWSSDRDGYLGQGTELTVSQLSAGWHTLTLTSTDSGNATGTAAIQLHSYAGIPTVQLLSPAAGQTFTARQEIALEATGGDDQDGDISANIRWTSDRDGTLGNGRILRVTTLSAGTHTLRAEVTDHDGWKASAQVVTHINSRQAPQTTLLFPREGSRFNFGKPVYFYGAATDAEDGTLSGNSLTWNSSLEGELGHGATLRKEGLTVGDHTLTLTAMDSDGTSTVSTVHFTITPLPPTVVIDLPATNLVVRAGTAVTFTGHGADTLTWSSGLQGALGTGSTVTVSNLSVGIHPITLTGIQNGLEGRAQIQVTVVDESSLSVNTFVDGTSEAVLDFTTQQDYTLNVKLPREATLNLAQMTVHAQRERVSAPQNQAAEEAAPERNPVVPTATEEAIPGINDENRIMPPLVPPTNSGGGGGDNMLENNDSLGVMSTNYTVLNHYMSSVNNWNNPPRKSPPDYLAGDEIGSWLQIGNLYEAGQIKWTWTSPNPNWNQDCIGNIQTGFQFWMDSCGWSANRNYVVGAWRVDVYLKANSETEWRYYFTENFNIHETPNQPPVIGILRHIPNTVYQNSPVTISINAVDNGASVETVFYWNDGMGWRNDVQPFYVTGNFYGEKNIGTFPEGVTVQYYATVKDFENNITQSSTQSFTVQDSDTTGPTISNIVIADLGDHDGTLDETERVRLSASIQDTSGVGVVLFAVDGQPVPLLSNTIAEIDPLPVGSHTLTITATDNDNSPATSTVTQTFEVTRRPVLLNPSLDVGADGSIDWNFNGEMTADQVLTSIQSPLQAYIAGHSPESDGRVMVPLRFHADRGYFMKVHQLNIAYRIIDTTPPVIGEAILNPVNPEAGQPMTITVPVTDNIGVAGVRAEWDTATATVSVAATVAGAGTYTATLTAPAGGVHDLFVTATDVTGLITTRIFPVTIVSNLPDLSVASAVFDPAEPLLAGTTVTANVVIRNTGNQTATVSVSVSATGITVAETYTETVAPNTTTTLTTSFVLPIPGEHAFTVTVDPDNLVAETDETNNAFTQNYTVTDGEAPVIVSWVVPETVGAGQTFTVQVDARDNVGVATVAAEWSGGIFTFNGDSTTLTAPAGLGEMPLTITVRDTAGLVTSVQKRIAVIDARPNLRIRAQDLVSVSDNILALDHPEFRITVENTGGTMTEGVLGIAMDGVPIVGAENLPRLRVTVPAGQTNTISWSDWAATGGSHLLTVTLDPENTVAEQDEGDNSASLAFVVPYTLPPQLSNLIVPENALENTPLNLAIDVLGDQELRGVAIDIDGRVVPMNAADPLVQTRFIASFPGLPTGTYPFTITATNISDLVARLPGVLTVHSPLADLMVEGITMTPAVLTNRDTARFGAVAKNNGHADVTDVPVAIRIDGVAIAGTSHVLSLQNGASIPLDAISWDPVPGSHTFEIVIDPDNSITEADETNNNALFSFTVANVIPPEMGEVSVKDIVYSGEAISIQAQITDEVPVEFSAVWRGLTPGITVSLPAGGLATIPVVAPANPGEYTLLLTARNRDGLTTFWERNITVLDARPDLAIVPAEIRIAPRRLVEDVTETITALLQNPGGSDVNDAEIVLQIGTGAPQTRRVSIPRGEQVSLDFPWTPVFGVGSIHLTVDPQNVIAESDEANNDYVASLGVQDETIPGVPQPYANSQSQTAENRWSDQQDWTISWPAVLERNLKGYAWQMDGEPFGPVGPSLLATVHFDTAGEHRFCVRAEDLAGNQSAISCVSLLLDLSPPQAPVLYGGTNDQWSSGNTRAISWDTPQDDGSGPQHYVLKIDDVVADVGLVNQHARRWEDGTYRVQVAGVDALGRQSEWSNEVVLMIDATPPSAPQIASSTHPNPDRPYTNPLPEFTWEVPQDLSGIEGYYYYINQNPATVPDSQYRFTQIPSLIEQKSLSSGMWYLHVVPVDNAGNKGAVTHFPVRITGNALFENLLVKPSVSANRIDRQELELILAVPDANQPAVDAVQIIINKVRTNSGNERGRFQYSPQRGFEEVGSNGSGNQFVTLLAKDAENSPAGSQVIPHPENRTVSYIFRWTMDPAYGDVATNTIDYQFVSAQYSSAFVRANATFAVSAAGYRAPSVRPLTVRPSVVANNTDRQEAALTLSVTDPSRPLIDAAQLIINHVRANSGNERGRFQYSPQRGFEEIGARAFGNQFVNLLPQDAQNSPAGSQVIPNQADGTITYVFRWTLDPSYGARTTNTVDYYFASGQYKIGFLRSNASFDVSR